MVNETDHAAEAERLMEYNHEELNGEQSRILLAQDAQTHALLALVAEVRRVAVALENRQPSLRCQHTGEILAPAGQRHYAGGLECFCGGVKP